MSAADPHPVSRKILLIRLDRIGDLTLTLPIDAAFRNDDVHWWVAAGLGFIANSALPPRRAREIAMRAKWPSMLAQWRSLFADLRRERPEIAIVFHAPWWINMALWAARIPTRIGPRSQWHSFLFFNRGVRQKRSRSTRHELDYNAELVEIGLCLPSGSVPREGLKLGSVLSEIESRALLERCALRPRDYFVVHVGMGGSALNWPVARWEELIRRLVAEFPVAMTGTAADEAHIAPLRVLLADHPAVHWLDGRLKTDELLAVLGSSRAVIAPSTGVLHLAASLGVRAVGLYSPVPVQAPRRWGPLGPHAQSLVPDVACPAHFSCLGIACPQYNCMERISTNDVYLAATHDSGSTSGVVP